MARALIDALEQSGHGVELASRLRSFDRNGDAARQRRIEHLGAKVADRLIKRYNARPMERRPTAWVTYHAYHKSPDWLGPTVSRSLDIPYLLIEASFAPKQAGGPWDLGHRAAEASIRTADVALAMTEVDEIGLTPLVKPPAALRRLPPFLDPSAYRIAHEDRRRHRRDLSERFGLQLDRPWLLAVGMMRNDVKRDSYALLAQALDRIRDRSWQILIVGDGPSRSMIENLFDSLGSERVKMAGILAEAELPACYAAADVYAWPAVREAYGMAFLEAQAAGLPVVAGREGGVQDVVRDGLTGLLAPPRDPEALALSVADLLDHPAKRKAMSDAGLVVVQREHGLDRAATRLSDALTDAKSIFAKRVKSHRDLS
jgi:glycosyltransferase involved in cell wall biosynthesis